MKILTDKKIQWIIGELEKGRYPGEMARFVRVTRMQIYHLKQQCKSEGRLPEPNDPGRKKKSLCPGFERLILDAYPVYQSGPVILEKIIKKL